MWGKTFVNHKMTCESKLCGTWVMFKMITPKSRSSFALSGWPSFYEKNSHWGRGLKCLGWRGGHFGPAYRCLCEIVSSCSSFRPDRSANPNEVKAKIKLSVSEYYFFFPLSYSLFTYNGVLLCHKEDKFDSFVEKWFTQRPEVKVK